MSNLENDYLCISDFHSCNKIGIKYIEFIRNIFSTFSILCNLDGPDGFSSYLQDLRHENPAFSAKSKTPLCWIITKMDSPDYTNLLDDVLITFIWTNKWTRAAIQKSGHSIEWFATKQMPSFDWPAYSPFLHPIENLYGILFREDYKNGRQFSLCN
jgi:hypothetical protein